MNAVSTKPVDFHTGPGINTNDIKKKQIRNKIY